MARLNPIRRRLPRRRGVVVLEMAIGLTVLIPLTFGLLEYGLMFWHMHHIANAARQGARIAARPDATTAQIEDAIKAAMNNAGLAVGEYVSTFNPADPTVLAAGTTFSVTISVPYGNIGLNIPFLPVPESLDSQITMAKEGDS